MSERVKLCTKEHGYLPSLGTVDTYTMPDNKRMCFAIVQHKQKRRVFFSIPGSGETFLEVHAEKVTDGDYDAAIERGMRTVRTLHQKYGELFSDFSHAMLTAQREKKHKLNRDYLLALLDEHKAFKVRDWK